jgi:hypothetical protein
LVRTITRTAPFVPTASVLSVGSPLMMTRFVRGNRTRGERFVGSVGAVVRDLLAHDE